MSSVRFKTASEEKMSMYEDMVEEIVGDDDENSRYILDGKLAKIDKKFLSVHNCQQNKTKKKITLNFFFVDHFHTNGRENCMCGCI